MDDNVEIGRAFEAAVREAAADAGLWVPGVGNGALGAVLKVLNGMTDDQIVAIIRKSAAHRPGQDNKDQQAKLAMRSTGANADAAFFRVEEERHRIVRLTRAEVEARLAQPGKWVLAIDPDTLAARIVSQEPDGFVGAVEGHEDLFPLSMAVERDDGFIEGGDWLVAHTPSKRPHDGVYRSYWVEWIDS